jgi:hypothetical protein
MYHVLLVMEMKEMEEKGAKKRCPVIQRRCKVRRRRRGS